MRVWINKPGSSAQALDLEAKPFASGGEGELYHVLSPVTWTSAVAKLFYPQKRDAQKLAKLRHLIAHPPAEAEALGLVWPQALLQDEQGGFLGYLMPKSGGQPLEVLCSLRLPRHLSALWSPYAFGHPESASRRLRLAYGLARALRCLQAQGSYVFADLKPDNILVEPDGRLSLVDLDSVEVQAQGRVLFPANVVTPEYSPPEYYRGLQPGQQTLSPSWDNFSLAVLLYRLLLGIHPFAASAAAPYEHLNTLGEKIEVGLFVHNQAWTSRLAVVPPPHGRFADLERSLQQLFLRAFVEGQDQPELRPWAKAWENQIARNPRFLVQRYLPSERVPIEAWHEGDLMSLALRRLNRQLNSDWRSPSSPNRQLPQVPEAQLGLKQSLSLAYTSIPGSIRDFLSRRRWWLLLLVGLLLLDIFVFRSFVLVRGARLLGLGLGRLVLGTRGLVVPVLLALPALRGLWWYFRQGGGKLPFNRAILEDWQYRFFQQRLEAKAKIQELKAQIQRFEQHRVQAGQALQVRLERLRQSRREQELQEIKARMRTLYSYLRPLDQEAQKLQEAEAKALHSFYGEVGARLSELPWRDLSGDTPQEKIQWLRQQPQVQRERLAALEAEDQAWQERLALLRKQYDQAHDNLRQQAFRLRQDLEKILEEWVEELAQTLKREEGGTEPSYKLQQNYEDLLHQLFAEEHRLQSLNERIREIRQKLMD